MFYSLVLYPGADSDQSMALREWYSGILLVAVGAWVLGSQLGIVIINATPAVNPAPPGFIFERTSYYLILDNFGIVVAGIALMSSGATILIRELLARGMTKLALGSRIIDVSTAKV